MNAFVIAPRTTWFFKFCECLLAAVALINSLTMGLEFLPRSVWQQYPSAGGYLVTGITGISLITAVTYSMIWHRRERADHIDSGLHHAWLQGVTRYWLALSISMYGFAKILKTQFQNPDYRLDMPMGEVNGFGLTWYYFRLLVQTGGHHRAVPDWRVYSAALPPDYSAGRDDPATGDGQHRLYQCIFRYR